MQSAPLVYLIDDNDEFVESSAKLIASVGLSTARFKSGEAFLNVLNVQQPGCVIIDLGKPHLDGIRVLDELERMPLSPPAIVLTDEADVAAVVRAARRGAIAFLQKQHISKSEILEAVQSALKRDSQQRAIHARREEIRARFAKLNTGERQVLELLLGGDDLLAIAQKLKVSRRTVESRRARLMKHLQVTTFPALIAIATEHRDLPPAS